MLPTLMFSRDARASFAYQLKTYQSARGAVGLGPELHLNVLINTAPERKTLNRFEPKLSRALI